MRQYNIYPECYVDTNLIGYIIGGHPKHKSTCNEVVKAVNNTDEFAVGIIDADKRQATLDSGFEEYVQGERIDGRDRHLSMYIHTDGKRFMFTVKPAMDKFIMHAASAEGINLEEYGFPSDFDEFRKSTKRIQAGNDPKLRNLFAAIAGYPELERLRNTLKYLVQKQYQASPEIAKQFFTGALTNADLPSYLLP